MRVLVTGANGFVGRHMTRELHASGHNPIRMQRLGEDLSDTDVKGDILDPISLTEAIAQTKPDACVHLAGLAFVPTAKKNPSLAFRLNTVGAMHVLDAFYRVQPNAKILVVTTSQIYGNRETTPLTEEHPPAPENIYAVSKLAADTASLLYAKHRDMHIMTARPHNHIGPGQSEKFVISAFAHQLATMVTGPSEPVMRVGNLESQRDFLDVRDVVRAYRLLLEKGHAGEAYNIASGELVQIRTALHRLAEAAGIQPHIEIDPDFFRPTDSSTLLDCSKIKEAVDWKRTISLDQTLRDVFADVQHATSMNQ